MHELVKTHLLKAALKSLEASSPNAASADNESWPRWLNVELMWRNFSQSFLYDIDYKCDDLNIQGPLFFLFWKNVSITNVQFVELQSLISHFSRCTQTKESYRVDFFSAKQYKFYTINLLNEIFSGFIAHSEKQAISLISKKITSLLDHFLEFFTKTVMFDCYSTSTVVVLPKTISISITEVVSRSSYVHSAGINVYTRNVSKTDADLGKAISSIVQKVFNLNGRKKDSSRLTRLNSLLMTRKGHLLYS